MSDDLVKRLRDSAWTGVCNTRVVYVGVDLLTQAADRIEQLEAENRELALQVLASGGQAQEAYEAQLKAEAATAAAYEVAAREVECGCGAGPCQDTANCAAKDAAAIRALATPDQTAALDKLIAEVEARAIERVVNIAASNFSGGFSNNRRVILAAILSASKKGGV